MENFLDNVLGFLPQRSIVWSALGSALIVIAFQKGTQKLQEFVKLPYMEEENQQKRKEITGQSGIDQQSKS
ncbi:hypothetical protein [Alkalihalobacterium chitinilyticum]|uniref:Uncharacterized protein n=1 Tax=Alkalihalobacterium chitinilyticum TaxID=2980103 RepID=A0ABT5VD65_9BACI|nr:hypothetical protein [Alkalihalobacterium chitinilyticum]MDE5413379.1 hypothetical protein [Alkalihalobacterium chitinilyticum]